MPHAPLSELDAKCLAAAGAMEVKVEREPVVADVSFAEAERDFVHQPAFRASELTPAQRRKVSKALRKYAFRFYLRLQFEQVLLCAEWTFFYVCQLCFELAVAAKSFFKDFTRRQDQ